MTSVNTRRMDTTSVAAALAPPPRKSPVGRFFGNPWTIRVLSLVTFLTVWEIAGMGDGMEFVISSPSRIAVAATEVFVPEVLPALGETLRGLIVGMLLSIVVGVPVGMLMAASKVVEVALSPYVMALYSTPRITLIPVLVLWLGISFEMRVGIVFLGAVFPILLNTYLGGKEVNQGLLDVGRAYSASGFKIYRSILLRGSVPYIFSGLRLGLGQGLTGVVVAEVATSAGGVGNLITNYARYFHVSEMFVAIVVLGLLAIVIVEGMARINASLSEPWNRKAGKRAHLAPMPGPTGGAV
jgi:ABC-type nitrate/sulfonate/bicarbonate transport system permease component